MISNRFIVDGICKALSEEFGSDYEIYTEDVHEGLVEPCFTVRLLKPSQEQFLNNRYYQTHLFCIHYFPKSDDANDECFDVSDRLNECLEYITVDGDLIRGTNMNSEMTDGVLSFFVNYDMFVIKKRDEVPVMETYTQTTSVKDDDNG